MEYLTSAISVHHIDSSFWDWDKSFGVLVNDNGQRTFPQREQGTFLTLPGTGQPGSDCGDPVPWFCNDEHKVFFVEHECGERQCPHCSHIWVRDHARIMKGRLWDGREHYKSKEGKTYRIHHCIVSYRVGVPDCRQSYGELRQNAQMVAKSAGIEGGGMVFHPWRESRDGIYDVVGPHFHVFGLSLWVKPGDEIEPYTDDIIFKRVRDFDARQLEPFEYVLSHCGIPEGCHAIVWFGNLAYNKMEKGPQEKRAKEITGSVPDCPYCGGNNTTYLGGMGWWKCEPWDEGKVM